MTNKNILLENQKLNLTKFLLIFPKIYIMRKLLSIYILSLITLFSCNNSTDTNEEFNFFAEKFQDIQVLRYQIPGFDELNLNQKKLVYYLTEAGLAGRDIMYDQNYRHNLSIRRALEKIYSNYDGDKRADEWNNFEVYLKRIWFANGIHHHYSNDKFDPNFSKEYLEYLLSETGTQLNKDAFEVIFNDNDSKKVNRDQSKGLVIGSAVNFYGDDVTEKDVDDFYSNKKSPDPNKPLSFGLNSKLVREGGELIEKTYKIDGMYSSSIEKIIFWIEKAKEVAENEKQKKAFDLLAKKFNESVEVILELTQKVEKLETVTKLHSMQESVKKNEVKPSQKGLKFFLFLLFVAGISYFFYKFDIDLSILKDISRDFLTILGK